MSDTEKAGSGFVGTAMSGLQAASDAAGKVGAQAGQAGGEALGHAQDVAHDAQSRAASLASEVKDRVSSGAQTQKDQLADRLEDVAKAVHRSGEQLEGHQDWIAGLVERGADELGALARTLRTNDLQSIMGNLGRLARQEPALFAGASLAAGFALARVGRVAVAGASKTDLPHTANAAPEASDGNG
ncbi:MAG: hypothetical protein ACRYG8_29985 [Janthinobacterium lividum]